MDRVRTVSFNLLHPDDPLVWALTDLNRVKTTELEEFLWLRVLDVPRALAARPWAADGDASCSRSTTPRDMPAGASTVTTRDGVATVIRTEEEAAVRVTAETLGSLYLGNVPVRQLHRAGRVAGADEDVRRFAAMADLREPAYNLTGF